MNRCFGLFPLLLLAACAGPREPLVVKQFQLRDQDPEAADEPLVRMEKERLLRGAVSMAERRGRLGQYYTLLWTLPEGAAAADTEVIFEYQQGATASRVKQLRQSFPASVRQGRVEFAVTGENYFKNGRVLAWRASLRHGGRELAARQSYLWKREANFRMED